MKANESVARSDEYTPVNQVMEDGNNARKCLVQHPKTIFYHKIWRYPEFWGLFYIPAFASDDLCSDLRLQVMKIPRFSQKMTKEWCLYIRKSGFGLAIEYTLCYTISGIK